MKMAETGSPVSKYVVKWQLALAVGLPVAVGVGYWYLNNKGKREKLKESNEKNKNKIPEISIAVGGKSAEKSKTSVSKTNLEVATELKEEGNKHFKRLNYDEAISSYEKAINICPAEETMSLAIFYQNKAAAYEQLQKYEDVKEACTKALSFNPNYTKALLRRAKACEQTKDLTQALEDIIAACILGNFQSKPTMLSADRILKELGHQHAKEAMAKKVPIMPSSSFIKHYFASFTNDPINKFLSKTDGDKSKGFLKAIESFKSENYESIIPACTEEINFTEAEAIYKNEALVLRATFYQLTGENKLAIPDLEIVINSSDVSATLRANALIKRASIHMQLEDLQSCLNDFNAAVAIDEHNSDIYLHRGQINLLMDKVKEAANDLALAVQLNPKNPIIVVQKCFTEYRLALLTKDLSTVSEVLKKFENAVTEFPDCTECYVLYAQVLADKQEFEKADEQFQKAIKIDPKNATLLVRRALLVLQWSGDVKTAVNYIDEAIEIDDKCEFAYETLGTIEVQKGNLKKAIELFDKAIALTKTELELTHLFSLKDAAIAQKVVLERIDMQPRRIF